MSKVQSKELAQYEKSQQQEQTPQETRDLQGNQLTSGQPHGEFIDMNEQLCKYLDIIYERNSEIKRLKQEILDLNNKLSQNKITSWIRKIV